MEGAVRSGRRAALMLAESEGKTTPSAIEELQKNLLIRLLVGS
jgi:hypothetical protein